MKNKTKGIANIKGLTELHQEIQQLDQERSERIQLFETKRNERLDQLHIELGYDAPEQLVEALINRGAIPSGKKITQKAAGKAGKAKSSTVEPIRGKRGRSGITREVKDAVVTDVKSGQFTSSEIARRHNISVPSVQNIKRDNNLIRSRAA